MASYPQPTHINTIFNPDDFLPKVSGSTINSSVFNTPIVSSGVPYLNGGNNKLSFDSGFSYNATTDVLSSANLAVTGNLNYSNNDVNVLSTKAFSNVKLGNDAGKSLSSSTSWNIAVGTQALLAHNNSGTDNIAIGALSMNAFNDSGGGNIAIGGSSLQQITAGTYNVAIGLLSGGDLSGSCSNNVLIGISDLATTTLNNAIVIGHRAGNGAVPVDNDVIMGCGGNVNNQLIRGSTLSGSLHWSPFSNNNANLGLSTRRWKDFYSTTTRSTYGYFGFDSPVNIFRPAAVQAFCGSGMTCVSACAFRADSIGSMIAVGKSRNSTIGSNTVLQSNDQMGCVVFCAANGTTGYPIGATIEGTVDGTISGDIIPGRINLQTVNSSGVNNTRLSIPSDGNSYFLGNLGIDTVPGSAKLQIYNTGTNFSVRIDSTTGGVLFPRMTTTQRNALSALAGGLVIYNTTTNTMQFYNGTSWFDM